MPKDTLSFVASAVVPATPMKRRLRQDGQGRPSKPNPLIRLRLRVAKFVKSNVPPSNTPQSDAWKLQAKSLGKGAAPYLVDFLQNGNEEEQYSALIALRENGFEAWGHGYNADFEYRVTINGKKQAVKPKHYEIIE